MNIVIVASAVAAAGLLLGCAQTAGPPQSAETPPETATVRSADGTRIGYTRVGSGPVPLVIVHGALSTGANWMPVATALADRCTCYVMDRWGRGASERRDALLLGGALTREHPSFATHTLAQTFADSRVVEIDGQGHTAHLGAPAEVARAIAEFLADAAE